MATATEKKKESPSIKYMVLALGLLIGFVIGFVMLLSSLPVDDSLVSFNAREATGFESPKAEYKFFEVLPDRVVPAAPERKYDDRQQAAPRVIRQVAPAQNTVAIRQPSSTVNLPANGPAIRQGSPVQAAPTNNLVIPAATRLVPANAQNLTNGGYTEVPANFKSQSYYLQAGNFPDPATAEVMRAQVLLLGLQAFIVTRQEPDGNIRHRVRVGPYQDQGLLTEAKKRMRRGQIEYHVIRVTG